MKVQEIYREQYDFKNNICIIGLAIKENFTIAYHKTNTNQYQYTDVFFKTRKEMFEKIGVLMNTAPIVNQIKETGKES